MSTCLGQDCKWQTTGAINPAEVWFTKYIELDIAAQIPVNDRTIHLGGGLGLVHFFVYDLFPKGIGGPIFTEENNAAAEYQACSYSTSSGFPMLLVG
jgi:hypothetical protein